MLFILFLYLNVYVVYFLLMEYILFHHYFYNELMVLLYILIMFLHIFLYNMFHLIIQINKIKYLILNLQINHNFKHLVFLLFLMKMLHIHHL